MRTETARAGRAAGVALLAAALLASPARAGDVERTPLQVTLETRFVETTLDDFEAFGIDWKVGPSDADPFGPQPAGAAVGAEAAGAPWTGTTGDPGPTLEALANAGDASVLAAPRVVTTDGETATVFAGGPLPAFSDPEAGDFPGTPEFGITLDVTPIVLDDGGIGLTLRIDVDRLALPPGAAPRVETRTVETNVAVPDRGTLLIGGLFPRPDPDASRVPVLGDVPVVGRLFRSRSATERRTTLLVFVTPVLYDPATGQPIHAGGGRPRTPSRPDGTRLEPVVRPKPDAQLQHGPQVPRGSQPGYGQRYPAR